MHDRERDPPDDADGLDDFDEVTQPSPGPRRAWQAVVALLLLGGGVAGGVLWGEHRAATRSGGPPEPKGASTNASPRGDAMSAMPGMPGTAPAGSAARADEPAEITLTADAVQRAGIKTETVRTGTTSSALSVPGTVTSNAYRDTKVNALVGGVARRVSAELGAAVDPGQPLAVLFSADLSEAQMKYLSMRAMLVADHQKFVRTEKLVTLGAASRQELEEVTALHEAHATEVAAARQRLMLLGLSERQVADLRDASHVVSDVTVVAPASGVIVARTVNPGQVVMAGQDLFVVTDLKTVWVIGDLYEKDFPNVGVGSSATVTVPAAPDMKLRGRVSYIDPRVDSGARTAKVRVEVPNTTGQLRLGMFVNVSFETAPTKPVTLIPQKAVQAIGDRTVVYVPADDGGRFVERPVKVAAQTGDFVQVLEGLKPGEKVVTDGSFFLRAEAARTRSGG